MSDPVLPPPLLLDATTSAQGAAASPLAPRRGLVRSSSAMDVALVATFAALLVVCSILPAIPLAVVPVPVTLQTFAVLLCGAVLGPRRGALAVGLYFLVGIAGVPVFSMGRSGLAIFTGLSAGYALSFPFAAVTVGLLVGRAPARAGQMTRALWVFGACVVSTVVFTYTMGIAGMMWRGNLSLSEAFVANAAFIPGDVLKCAVVAVVAGAVHRAFPDLLPQRRA